eukprot:m.100771 g.100771  ORF g.100771 m.100771 type:complete len:354 (+) comp12555_c1_seq1:51-1112(+)
MSQSIINNVEIDGNGEVMSALTASLVATLFTWFVTALGAAVVFVSRPTKTFLDGSLGFAGGVMVAASFWSLIAPSIEIAENTGFGPFSFIPSAVGIVLGALFVDQAERIFPVEKLLMLGNKGDDKKVDSSDRDVLGQDDEFQREGSVSSSQRTAVTSRKRRSRTLQKRTRLPSIDEEGIVTGSEMKEQNDEEELNQSKIMSWKRTVMLAIAVTVHNIPEGLAVGVAFGSVGSSPSATFASAVGLAIGIAIQNFPEGTSVSVPLHRCGMSKMRSFMYGQMSGVVEPISGVLGCIFIKFATPLLPYALGFAAGAMLFVVVEDIIPEYINGSRARFANWCFVLGFIVMMSLDVGLG